MDGQASADGSRTGGDAPAPVLLRTSAGVATLTLNRPDRMNAWTPEMEAAWNDLLDRVVADDGVRVLVVTGAGRAFCAGMDVAVLAERSKMGPPPRRTRPLTRLADLPKPVVGAIDGPCVGLGLALALCCDVRFAAEGARFATAFARRGLVAEFGTSWRLPRLVGHARAADLLLTGRECPADEAERMGLVNWVVPAAELQPRAREWAEALAASCSPLSMAAIKQQLSADWGRSAAESEQAAAALSRQQELRRDVSEGVASFREHRPPRFAPLGPWPPVS